MGTVLKRCHFHNNYRSNIKLEQSTFNNSGKMEPRAVLTESIHVCFCSICRSEKEDLKCIKPSCKHALLWNFYLYAFFMEDKLHINLLTIFSEAHIVPVSDMAV